jgi:hypothetical protein
VDDLRRPVVVAGLGQLADPEEEALRGVILLHHDPGAVDVARRDGGGGGAGNGREEDGDREETDRGVPDRAVSAGSEPHGASSPSRVTDANSGSPRADRRAVLHP